MNSEACPEDLDRANTHDTPLVILLDRGIFANCAMMLGLSRVYPPRNDDMVFCAENAVQKSHTLICELLSELQLYTTELEIYGAVFGPQNVDEGRDMFVDRMSSFRSENYADPRNKAFLKLDNDARRKTAKMLYDAWFVGLDDLFGCFLREQLPHNGVWNFPLKNHDWDMSIGKIDLSWYPYQFNSFSAIDDW
jgi:hypothetical protein